MCSLDQSQGRGNQNYIEILDYFGYFIVKFSVVTNTFCHLAYLILITVNPLRECLCKSGPVDFA